jgi:hypothetical protein
MGETRKGLRSHCLPIKTRGLSRNHFPEKCRSPASLLQGHHQLIQKSESKQVTRSWLQQGIICLANRRRGIEPHLLLLQGQLGAIDTNLLRYNQERFSSQEMHQILSDLLSASSLHRTIRLGPQRTKQSIQLPQSTNNAYHSVIKSTTNLYFIRYLDR